TANVLLVPRGPDGRERHPLGRAASWCGQELAAAPVLILPIGGGDVRASHVPDADRTWGEVGVEVGGAGASGHRASCAGRAGRATGECLRSTPGARRAGGTLIVTAPVGPPGRTRPSARRPAPPPGGSPRAREAPRGTGRTARGSRSGGTPSS